MGLFDRLKGAAGAAQQAGRDAEATVAAARAASGAPHAAGVAGMTAAEQQALVDQAMSRPATQAEADFRNTGGTADEAAFAPAANGVTWQQYAEVIAQSQALGYDQSAIAAAAGARGIDAAAWTAAAEEFGARAQTNPAVGREMGRIVREGRA